MTIEILPNDILLEIFSFYVEEIPEPWEAHVFERIHEWITLVHVSQRWRDLAFTSSRRHNLRILCTNRRPARDMLDVWPTLPLVIWYRETGNGHPLPRMKARDDANDIIYALGHRDRVSQVFLGSLPLSVLDRLVPSMQESFPALTCLEIDPMDGKPPLVLQDSFLGGSAPCLRSLRLHGARFPALQKLLLSASNLVNLELLTIPVSAYISPEAISTLLPSFPRLEVFYLGFRRLSMDPRPAIQHPPPTRVDLPSLTRFWFSGPNEYLDQLAARIKTPLLCEFEMVFHNRGDLDVSQVTEFIDRVEKFKTLDRAEVFLCDCYRRFDGNP